MAKNWHFLPKIAFFAKNDFKNEIFGQKFSHFLAKIIIFLINFW
jgi:hypothetical protein